LSDHYRITELESGSYSERTERNVVDGDATLILSRGSLTGGSALTEKIARRLNKPCLHIDFEEADLNRAVLAVGQWLAQHEVRVLNVAGPRASSDPHIYATAKELVIELIGRRGL
jgi:hypothetical protein